VSAKLPAVKPRELVRVLEKKGWRLDRVRGSHHIMVHPALKKAVSVPMHNRDLKTGTLHGILRVAGISRQEFIELL